MVWQRKRQKQICGCGVMYDRSDLTVTKHGVCFTHRSQPIVLCATAAIAYVIMVIQTFIELCVTTAKRIQQNVFGSIL